MDADILKGKWNQLKGMVKAQWGKLTDNEIDQIQGKSEKLIGLLQEKYAYTKEKAEAEIADFVSQNS